MMRAVASQNVEMNGVENTAGSTRMVLASSGIMPPTVAAMVHTDTMVSPITVPISESVHQRRDGEADCAERSAHGETDANPPSGHPADVARASLAGSQQRVTVVAACERCCRRCR